MGAGAMFRRMLRAELLSVRWMVFTFLVLIVAVLTAIGLPALLDEYRASATATKTLLVGLHFPLIAGSFILALHALLAGGVRGSREWDDKTAVLLYSQPVHPLSLFLAQSGAVWVGQMISVLVGCLGGLVAGTVTGQAGVGAFDWWIILGGILFGLLPLCVLGTLLGVTRRRASSAMFLGFALVALLLPLVGAASAAAALSDPEFKAMGKYTDEMDEQAYGCMGTAQGTVDDYEMAVAGQAGDVEQRYAAARGDVDAAVICSERIFAASDAFYEERGVIPPRHPVDDMTQRLANARASQLGQPAPAAPPRQEGASDSAISSAYEAAYATKFDSFGVQWSRYLNTVGLLTIGEAWTGEPIIKNGFGPARGSLLQPLVFVLLFGEDALAFDVVPFNPVVATLAVLGQTGLWIGLAAISLRRRDLV